MRETNGCGPPGPRVVAGHNKVGELGVVAAGAVDVEEAEDGEGHRSQLQVDALRKHQRGASAEHQTYRVVQ